MQEIHHHAGNLIFKEGDQGDTVGYILSGRVEVSKEVNGGDVVLGDVGAGEFVGEMSVIEGRPRAASVRALTDVGLRLLSQEEFTERLREEPDVALQIILRLSERLRAANEQITALRADGKAPAEAPAATAAPAASQPAVEALRLYAHSSRMETALPADGLTIDALPYHVGRPSSRRERPAHVEVDLLLQDKQPYRLSRAHFALIRSGDAYAVRDMGSHLGTIVNGELIGQHAPKSIATLKAGENRIVAGGKDSPYAFRVVVNG